jgi:ribonuclease Z
MGSENILARLIGAVAVLPAILNLALAAQPQESTQPASHTQIVLLGTGNPAPDPDRSGPATAIVVNGAAYLVDFGPGVVRRAKAAVVDKGVKALEPTNIRVAFVPICTRTTPSGIPI